ncbi:MAG: hypothetical protein LBG91_03870, partial [Treponema sp.]|nr:hypothetical protein [Treponema sp.]
MKKFFAVLSAVLFAFSACPVFEPLLPLDGITVFLDDAVQDSVTIEEGQCITLRAEVSPSME